jgi:hypothetical protein
MGSRCGRGSGGAKDQVGGQASASTGLAVRIGHLWREGSRARGQEDGEETVAEVVEHRRRGWWSAGEALDPTVGGRRGCRSDRGDRAPAMQRVRLKRKEGTTTARDGGVRGPGSSGTVDPVAGG